MRISPLLKLIQILFLLKIYLKLHLHQVCLITILTLAIALNRFLKNVIKKRWIPNIINSRQSNKFRKVVLEELKAQSLNQNRIAHWAAILQFNPLREKNRNLLNLIVMKRENSTLELTRSIWKIKFRWRRDLEEKSLTIMNTTVLPLTKSKSGNRWLRIQRASQNKK